MNNMIASPDGEGTEQYFRFNFTEFYPHLRIEVENVCIINVHKEHDHYYELRAFFYEKKHIAFYSTRSKKEMFGAVQYLVNQYLRNS